MRPCPPPPADHAVNESSLYPPKPVATEATGRHDDEAKSRDQKEDETESKKRELPAAKDRASKVKIGFGVLGKRPAPASRGISIKMKPQVVVWRE